ncbi:MAG: hypothetical protein F6K30_15045, partial [Cyanothece sp. SIO2G6]|nr:hypothetical protein [Cyanothece sp. SIO2G6]
MDLIYQYAWLIPVFPLLGAAIIGVALVAYGDALRKYRSLCSTFISSYFLIENGKTADILTQLRGCDRVQSVWRK